MLKVKNKVIMIGDSAQPPTVSRKTVSFSKNVFLPVTNLCRNRCEYCGFREEENEAWIMNGEEVLELCRKGKKRDVTEALITLGEKPEELDRMRNKLRGWGYDSTVEYLADLAEDILKLGLLPHINAGILDTEELKKLREYSASMGLMLETTAEISAHEKSPGKDPELRLDTIRKAGELKIPFTTGILVGIGEEWGDRIRSLEKIREIHEEYGHIQEVIIQPFRPKPGTPMEESPPPTRADILETLESAGKIMPDMNIQVPPNLVRNISEFIEAGANDLGGISTLTPDFINPENEWPDVEKLKSEVEDMGLGLKERLPIYPEFTGKSDFMSEEITKVVKELSDEKGFREV